MYDVSKHYQNAIDKAIAKKRANIPSKFMEIKNIKDRTKAIKNYVNNVSKTDINEQIMINDLISEIFEKYNNAMENGENVSKMFRDRRTKAGYSVPRSVRTQMDFR